MAAERRMVEVLTVYRRAEPPVIVAGQPGSSAVPETLQPQEEAIERQPQREAAVVERPPQREAAVVEARSVVPIRAEVSAQAERAALRESVRKYATNLTPEAPEEEALLDLLMNKAVTPRELEELFKESYIRDTGRAMAFGAINSISRLTDLGIGEAIMAAAPDSLANHFPIGSFVNGAVSTAVQTGGKSLGPRYHPEARIPARPYDFFGVNEGTASFDDPYYPVSAAHAAGIGISAVAGTGRAASFAISASLIVLGYMARGYKTFKNEEAIRTSGGTDMRQPWLNAADLAKTEAAIDDLRQPRVKALTGYGAEILDVLRYRPWPAIKVAGYSPRTMAHTLAVLPGGILDAFSRAAPDPISSTGWSVVANQGNVFVLQHRLHIELYLTAGVNNLLGTDWSHSGAVARSGMDSAGRRTAQNDEEVEAGVMPDARGGRTDHALQRSTRRSLV